MNKSYYKCKAQVPKALLKIKSHLGSVMRLCVFYWLSTQQILTNGSNCANISPY